MFLNIPGFSPHRYIGAKAYRNLVTFVPLPKGAGQLNTIFCCNSRANYSQIKTIDMKKIIKRILYTIFFLVAAICILGLVLAYLPTEWKIPNKGITPEQAAELRQNYMGPHNEFTTSDGE